MSSRATNKSSPWIERYRPAKLGDVRGNAEIVMRLQSYQTIESLPHLLFHGPPGSGKTSAALAIAKRFFGNPRSPMVMELNAGDSRGVIAMRNQIQHFARRSSVETKGGRRGTKFLILDEADSLTEHSQNALRHLMETLGGSTKFCLCCNFVNKLAAGIRSRCTPYKFSAIGGGEMREVLRSVSRQEGLVVGEGELDRVVDTASGDARCGINLLQSLCLGKSVGTTGDALLRSFCSPCEQDMADLTHTLVSETFCAAYNRLQSIVSENQCSLVQIIASLANRVVAACDGGSVGSEKVGNILEHLAEVERCLSGGVDGSIAMGAIVAAFQNA